MAARTDVFTPDVQAAFGVVSERARETDAPSALLRGIFGGWLIALMVWLLPMAEGSRFWVILVVTYMVGLGTFAHVVAGSVEMLYLVSTGAQSWGEYLGLFLVPTLIGNTIGGVSLVAALNHAQVVAGGPQRRTEHKTERS